MSQPWLREHPERTEADITFDISIERSATLYRLHRGLVYARCRRLLKDRAAAEDATQETFERAFRHWPVPSDADGQRRWLCRIASNYCLNQLRNRKRHAELMRLWDPGAGADPRVAIDARQLAGRIARGLPDHVRQAAWLIYVDELDQQQAAEALGVSRRTVVNLLAAFRKKVRRRTEDKSSPQPAL